MKFRETNLFEQQSLKMQLIPFFLYLFMLLVCCNDLQLVPAGMFPRLDSLSAPQYHQEELSNTLSNNCPRVTCVGTGQACSPALEGSSAALCDPNTSSCMMEGTTSNCVALIPAGGECNSNLNTCVSGYGCTNGICVLNPYVPPGYACSSNDQCYFPIDGDNSLYGNSTCINGLCYSIPDGQNCTISLQCSSVSFCSDSQVCVPVLTQGFICDASNLCALPLLCYAASLNATQGTCQPYFLGSVGNFCFDSGYCYPGLYCNTDYQCDVPFTPTSASCTSDIDCPNNEYCQCSYVTGTQTCQLGGGIIIPNNAVTVNNNYLQCALKSNCADVMCFLNTCKSAYCAFLVAQQNIPNFQQAPQCSLTPDQILVLQACAPSSSAPSSFSGLYMKYMSFLLLVCTLLMF